jgi:hypothetical protein
MKRTIRLTEKDLSRIVKRVVNEAQSGVIITIPYDECTIENMKTNVDGGKWYIKDGELLLRSADNSKFCKVSTIK